MAFPLRRVLAMLAAVPALAAAQPSPPLSIDETVHFAAHQSRQVAALRAQAQAARDLAVAAGRRPDPVLKLGIANLPIEGADRLSTARDSMTMRQAGVMQESTRSDKLRARTERAEADVAAAGIAAQQALATLQRDAALAWLDRSFQESMLHLLRAQRSQAVLQVEATESQYRANRAASADVLLARTQVEQLDDRIATTEQQVALAQSRLERWIGRIASRPLQARPSFTLPDWTAEDLDRHLARHPQIAASAQQEAIAEAEVKLADVQRHADWSVELMLQQRGSSYANMVSLNLSVPLTWDRANRQDRELAARLSLREKARADHDDAQRAHLAEVRAMIGDWQRLKARQSRHADRLVPLAAQRSEAALAAWRAGSGTLPMLLDTRRAELEARMDALRVEMDLARTWAELTFLLPHDEEPSPEARR